MVNAIMSEGSALQELNTGALGQVSEEVFSQSTKDFINRQSDYESVGQVVNAIDESKYKTDIVSDVHKGLNLLSTGIKVISAILTVMGGGGNQR